MYFLGWRGHYIHDWVRPLSCPTLQVSPTSNVVQSHIHVWFHMFRKALFIPVHTRMYQCCTSTYSHRSHSHFISIQAPSRLRPSLWFVQLDHPSIFHRSGDGQLELLKGAEENQVVPEIIWACFVTASFWHSSTLWAQVATEKELGRAAQQSSKGTSWRSSLME